MDGDIVKGGTQHSAVGIQRLHILGRNHKSKDPNPFFPGKL